MRAWRNCCYQLDVPPRQVLIEAQILEVDLTGQFSFGVQAWLQKVGATNPGSVPGSTSSAARALIGAFDGATTTLSAGTLVGQSRQHSSVCSPPRKAPAAPRSSPARLIATDSIPAYINVGDTVPTLASQAVPAPNPAAVRCSLTPSRTSPPAQPSTSPRASIPAAS